MAQPRYSEALKHFINDWRPNDPELDKRFVEAVRGLVSAILAPPNGTFEVETILSPSGGKVVLRLADYEAQIAPLDAQHLALGLMEAATSARTESWLFRFLQSMGMNPEHGARIVGEFRSYRTEEMQKELDGDFERRNAQPDTTS